MKEMSAKKSEKSGLLHRIRSSLSRKLVAQVPDEMSCCEFECRRTECLEGEWDQCRQRLDYAERLREDRDQEPG
jgi:hypothetical protein